MCRQTRLWDMSCLFLVLYGSYERAANGKSQVCYGQPLQVAVDTLFYGLEGNTNLLDCKANKICLKILAVSLPTKPSVQQLQSFQSSLASSHLEHGQGRVIFLDVW